MKLYNSITRQVEEFTPRDNSHVGMYTCGMTVYDYAHIGHGRKYVLDDLLRRTLTFVGYDVKHVQNVTDVGHLSSDSDEGDDKMEKRALTVGKTVWEIAQFFMDNFYETMDMLGVLRPSIVCRATDHIPEQIALIEKLFENGHAYDTPEAVYFDVVSFPGYGSLLGQALGEKQQAVREEVQTGTHKRHPADFALWFKRTGRFEHHSMHWPSPWGEGFPGWHIECSAMSMKYLGPQFDIHTGGEDHLPIHHPNEIAQSEGATGKQPFVRYWIHYAHLLIDGRKMSKSLGNFFTIKDVEEKDIDPLALRYFYMTAHYRKHMNFTWDALRDAQRAYKRLINVIRETGQDVERTVLSGEKLEKINAYRASFTDAITDDLNFPEALAVVWEVAKSNIPGVDKRDLLLAFDEVLGLKLSEQSQKLPEADSAHIIALRKEREELRANKKFEEADALRQQIEELGYTVQDAPVKD